MTSVIVGLKAFLAIAAFVGWISCWIEWSIRGSFWRIPVGVTICLGVPIAIVVAFLSLP